MFTPGVVVGAVAIVVVVGLVLVLSIMPGAFSQGKQQGQSSTPSTAPSETADGTGSSSGGATESGKDSTTTAPSKPTPSSPTKLDVQIEEEARKKGLDVLKGWAHAHHENWNSGKGKVISVTLDEPVKYNFTYKGSSSMITVKEVEVALEGNVNYNEWTIYDGEYVVFSCEGLTQAIRDASMRGVDAIAKNPAPLYTL